MILLSIENKIAYVYTESKCYTAAVLHKNGVLVSYTAMT